MSFITRDTWRAAEQLEAGNLVGFPTETVYGLGADATNEVAIRKVFAAKGRPLDHPLIVHIATYEDMVAWARDISPLAISLAKKFWPGPLTMVLPKQPWVSDLITAGQDTVALRIPNHDLTLKLLVQFGKGMVGPSANRYQYVSPTSAQHVIDDLGAEVSLVLDGGPCGVGIESTIVYLADNQYKILRRGSLDVQISDALASVDSLPANYHAIKAPGTDLLHYAPRNGLQIVAAHELDDTVYTAVQRGLNVAVLSFHQCPANLIGAKVIWQQVELTAISYAQHLYANLRRHDHPHNDLIIWEQVPDTVEWAAIRDRLTRAVGTQIIKCTTVA